MHDEVKIFVYGSCHFSERLDSDEVIGNGGYGVVINMDEQRQELSGGFSNTTNARMDIMGITESLKKIDKPSNITIFLSNGYVIDTLTKGWLQKWKANSFKKKKHADLWMKLDHVLNKNTHKITFKHSKEVVNFRDFKAAEQLGKSMSGKKNLPIDLKKPNNEAELFELSNDKDVPNQVSDVEDDTPILESICVDASSIQNPGPTEYKAVDTKTKQVLFENRLEDATNNIGEFLAIVHALALYKRQQKELKVIYSDSLNAISWVKQKKCKTKLEQTETNQKTFEIIDRAILWLQNNTYDTKILKWNTGAWGEIPADYGIK
jgi:ribonuclease HI